MVSATSTGYNPRLDERASSSFESLIVDLLFRARNVPDSSLDAAIANTLDELVRLLDLDQGILILWAPGMDGIGVEKSWCTPQDSPFLFPLDPVSTQWICQQLSENRSVCFSNIDDLPAEAAQDKQALHCSGSGSLACVPVSFGNDVVGALAFVKKGQGVPWPTELIRKLQLCVGPFASFVARRQRHHRIEAQYQTEKLMAGIAARMAAIPALELDAAIEDAQRMVCRELGLDRSALWQASDAQPDVMLLTHLHQPEDGPKWQKQPAPSPLTSSYWVQTADAPGAYLRLDVKTLFPWIHQQLQIGETITIPSVDNLPEEAAQDRSHLRKYGTRSTVIVPLRIGGRVLGCLTFASTREAKAWSQDHIRRFECVAHIFANALARRRSDQVLLENNERLAQTVQELKAVQEQLRQENITLAGEVHGSRERLPIVGNSDRLMNVIRQAERVAATDSTVLILGETGTGKELLAQYIHRVSGRSKKPFIATNVAAIPATLLESELFGREKGAYTGALTREIGRFQMADGGTLFLDEIGEMPLETQAKLLRVLQTGQFERLGSGQTIQVDIRVIAATNRELSHLTTSGTFRQDLLYRLNVFPLTLPPLRNRREDIPLLVWTFMRELSKAMGRVFERIRRKDLEALQNYAWPGNIRELRNVVERSMILCEGPELRLVLPEVHPGETSTSSRLLTDIERQHIQNVLSSVHGRIRGPGGAAEILGLKPTTLYSLMDRLGIGRTSLRRNTVDASTNRPPHPGN